MDTFDVAIVGAGIAGASLAWRLAPQCRVLLLERESQPGCHATGRSAAMFIESYGPAAVRALTRASRAFYETPPAGFATTPLLTPRGALYLAPPGETTALDALEAELRPSCPQLQRLPAGEAPRRVPVLRPEASGEALFDPTAQDIDVDALLQGFLRGARAAGAQLRCDTTVESASRDTGGWTLRLREREPVRAELVVDAAGAWADEFAQRCGVRPAGLTPRRRSAFTFDAAGHRPTDWPAVIDAHERWYFKPEAGRLLGSPANADDTVPHDVRPQELDIALGIDRIQTATTLTIRRPGSTWAGLRTFAPDGEPVIGWDDACPGFFWLAGQGGYGIQSAAGASALAAALLTAAPLPDGLRAQGLDPRATAVQRLR